MARPLFVKHFAIVTAVIIIIIIHGSLYPYAFRVPPGDVGPVGTLLGSWAVPPTSFGDLVANILLYMPLGFFGVLSLDCGAAKRLALVTLFGLALCTCVELTQFYDEGRIDNFSDIYLNTLGAALGGASGLLFSTNIRWPLLREASTQPFPLLLLAAMLGERLYPYVPTIDLHKYWRALAPIFREPSLDPYDVFRFGVLWLTVCYLMAAIFGRQRVWFLLPLVAGFVFGGKVLIHGRIVTLPDLVGAALAFGAWFLLPAVRQRRAAIVAALLGALIIMWRLEPFQFNMTARHFVWTPFMGFLRGSLDVGIQSFMEKFFLYGGMIWLLRESGLRLIWGAFLVAATLLATSVAELYLPGRTGEITDAIMALLIAGILGLITHAGMPETRIAPPSLQKGPR
jgi:VanZ family protein